MKERILGFIHVVNVLAVSVILLVAFFMQFSYHELPCPLCLMQRMGFMLIAAGFLMNIRWGYNPIHYGLALLASVYTFITSILQVLLHIGPNDPGYGDKFLGLHLYTWSAVTSIVYMIVIGCCLFPSFQFSLSRSDINSLRAPRLSLALAIALMIFIVANLFSTLLECGITLCPSDPVSYQLAPNL